MQIEIVDSWNGYLDGFPDEKKDIYFTEEYVKLYEDQENKALCILCREKEKCLLLPFLRGQYVDMYDFETAYGYGGPIANTEDEMWIQKSLEKISGYLASRNYLCGFVRFHPLLDNQKIAGGVWKTLFDRCTVSVNLEPSAEEIWKEQITSKNRNMIRKAEKNALTFQAEYDMASMREFRALYEDTMDRLHADRSYYFNDFYFEEFSDKLKESSFLGTVRLNGKLICAALFLYSKRYGHYHLEGSDHEYRSLGANNFLLWNAIIELKRLGVKEFHLGGGYDTAEQNSLLLFKKSFSPGLKEFYIGKAVFDRKKYELIREIWMEENPDKKDLYANRLLCYRY